MASVQFYGVDQVMQAAENYRCSCWAIFINGRLFTKFEDSDLVTSMQILEKNLDALEGSQSNGIYTLKFFECAAGKAIKINEKTVCDGGSFNFKLVGEEERQQRGLAMGSVYNQTREMQKQIDELKQQLAGKDDEPETDQSIGAVVIDLLKNPGELAQLINIGRSMMGLPVQQFGPGAIGTTRIGETETATVIDQEEKLTRLGNAIDTLEQSDPRLIEHLEKLAQMAKENPEGFNSLLSFI